MKSQKGITIISLIVYVMSFFAICGVVAVITNFFHNNTKVLSDEATSYSEYDMLNAYLVKETRQLENFAVLNGSSLAFKSGNEYIFTKEENEEYGEIILKNKEKSKYFIISKYVKNCTFEIVEDTNTIKIEVEILDKKYNQTYTIEQ